MSQHVTERVLGVWLLSALKANKKARLVERKVCFILDADNCGRAGWWTPVQRPFPPPQAGMRASIDGWRGEVEGRASGNREGLLVKQLSQL